MPSARRACLAVTITKVEMKRNSVDRADTLKAASTSILVGEGAFQGQVRCDTRIPCERRVG